MHAAVTDDDLTLALALAVVVIVVGSLVRSTAGNEVALLLGGTAGAFLTRWRLFERVRRGWVAASVALCSAAGVMPLLALALR